MGGGISLSNGHAQLKPDGCSLLLEYGLVYSNGNKGILIIVNIWDLIGSQHMKGLHQCAVTIRAGWI